MIAQARAELPNECCGLLGGTIDAGAAIVKVRYPIANALASPVEFLSEPRDLFAAVDQVAAEAQRRVAPAEVAAVVKQAVDRRPISVRGEPLTIQSAVQVSVAPPTFALKVNRPEEIHFSYQRYLVRSLRLAFGFTGSPIRLSLRRASSSRPRRGARR